MSAQRVLSIGFVVLGTIIGFAALWKWALFGLDSDVGFAYFITVVVLVGGGLIGAVE